MYIIGISAFYHDSAVCLVKDGHIVAAAQEERFTRKKFDNNFPRHSLEFCLARQKITIDDVDLIVFYENPAAKFNRILEMIMGSEDQNKDRMEGILNRWIQNRYWYEDIIRRETGFKNKIVFPLHHQSHAASAFFPSPFKEAAILTYDGAGEYMTTSMGVGADNRISLLKCIEFPHSLGLLYSAFTYFCGFKVNSGEYKLMGLAPYGEKKYVDLIKKELIDIKDDGSFKLNLKYFGYVNSDSMINDDFRKLFGRAERRPESEITQDDMDIAMSIQTVVEEVILKITRYTRDVTGKRYLCMAGGVALNCVANGKILKEKIFDGLWIQPAAGDAGGALGAALFGWYQYLRKGRMPQEAAGLQQGSFLGPDFSGREIRDFLDATGAVYRDLDEEDLVDEISKLIVDEKVVGHFNGRMEFGPRALGNRSILGDARSPHLQRDMNVKIKFRESFRPFAPSVVDESADDFFDLGTESPYMLVAVPIKDRIKRNGELAGEKKGMEKLKIPRSVIPAVTHVDYSARVQTVDEKTNPRFYGIIRAVGRQSGVPVVINTSFNVRGEPIVCTPADAYNCFMNTGMDYLVLGNCLLSKKEQPERVAGQEKEAFHLD